MQQKLTGINYWLNQKSSALIGGFFLCCIIKRPFLYTAIGSYLLLTILVWFSPVAFSAIFTNSFSTSLAYFFTESAGKYGTALLIIGSSYAYTIRFERKREKLATFIKSFVAVTLLLALFAYTNEHVTKPLAKVARPSHVFMLKQVNMLPQLDSLYALSKNNRELFFDALSNEYATQFQKIDKRVLSHWVEEAGFSFPSGHTFNAFLLATILAFGLYNATNKQLHRYVYVPFLWAVSVGISRVAIGAHTALDVTAGAGLGLMLGLLFLYFDGTRNLIIHRKPNP